jgi:hypothetical protein
MGLLSICTSLMMNAINYRTFTQNIKVKMLRFRFLMEHAGGRYETRSPIQNFPFDLDRRVYPIIRCSASNRVVTAACDEPASQNCRKGRLIRDDLAAVHSIGTSRGRKDGWQDK